ncbi:hypothetical protein ACFL4F_04145, partial [Candidatus Margulisiibacteriota bacterium]
LFTTESGNDPTGWDETLNVSCDDEGVFSVILGDAADPLDAVNFDQPLWMEIVYDSQIFAPRQKLTMTPYTFYAVSAETAETTLALSSEAVVISDTLVGIGTTSPTATLEVLGQVKMLGGFNARATDTPYYAETDGFVTVFLNTSGSPKSASIQGQVNGATILAEHALAGQYVSFMMPVKKGSTWQTAYWVQVIPGIDPGLVIYWVPLGQ